MLVLEVNNNRNNIIGTIIQSSQENYCKYIVLKVAFRNVRAQIVVSKFRVGEYLIYRTVPNVVER